MIVNFVFRIKRDCTIYTAKTEGADQLRGKPLFSLMMLLIQTESSERRMPKHQMTVKRKFEVHFEDTLTYTETIQTLEKLIPGHTSEPHHEKTNILVSHLV